MKHARISWAISMAIVALIGLFLSRAMDKGAAQPGSINEQPDAGPISEEGLPSSMAMQEILPLQAALGQPDKAIGKLDMAALVEQWEEKAAQGDSEALSWLSSLRSICMISMDKNRRSDRIDHSTWRIWTSQCDQSRMDLWMELGRSHVPLQSPLWDRLPSVREDQLDADTMAARDRILEDILASTKDPEEAASAAYGYLDRERQLAWAGGEIPNSLHLPGASEALRMDTAILYACERGRDCTPYAPLTLAECAMTAGCLPGVSMRQIVEMRRSPQEMQLIDLLRRRLLEVSS